MSYTCTHRSLDHNHLSKIIGQNIQFSGKIMLYNVYLPSKLSYIQDLAMKSSIGFDHEPGTYSFTPKDLPVDYPVLF